MKLTKFAQSCVLIETKGKRILVDPGNLLLDKCKPFWHNIDIILVTHKHGDHCDLESIKEIMANSKISTKLYSSNEVAQAYPELSIELVKVGDIINKNNIDEIKIEIVKSVHGYIPFLKGDKAIKENIGFIIDDGVKRVYFTGDTVCFDNDYKCNIIFVPVCNHGVVMGPWEAALFAKETGAELVIPYHYDHPSHPVDLELVKKEFTEQEINYKILNVSESLEL